MSKPRSESLPKVEPEKYLDWVESRTFDGGPAADANPDIDQEPVRAEMTQAIKTVVAIDRL